MALSPTSSRGGAAAFHGVSVYRNAALNWDGSTLPFDVVDYDTDSFWSAITHKVTIPAGLGGKYLLVVGVELAGDALLTEAFAYGEASEVGVSPLAVLLVRDTALTFRAGVGSCVMRGAVGDTFYVDGSLTGVASNAISTGDHNTFFQMTYLG